MVRDKQIEEKKRILRQRAEEEKRKDLMMEVERLKKIEVAEVVVKERVTEIKKGREVITEQIRDRELQRMKIKEEQAREAQIMLKHIKQMQHEEVESKFKTRDKIKKIQDEIYEANQAAIEKKSVRIQRELEEEEKIIKFNQDKAIKEAEFITEQK